MNDDRVVNCERAFTEAKIQVPLDPQLCNTLFSTRETVGTFISIQRIFFD